MNHNKESPNIGFVNANTYKAIQWDPLTKPLYLPLSSRNEGQKKYTYQKISLYIGENWLYTVKNEEAVADNWIFSWTISIL